MFEHILEKLRSTSLNINMPATVNNNKIPNTMETTNSKAHVTFLQAPSIKLKLEKNCM